MSVTVGQPGKVSISDAVNMVDALVKKELKDLGNSNPSTGGFYYSANTDANFFHRNVFTTAPNNCLQEAEQLDKMVNLIERAKAYAVLLYTWRSCTIPLPKNMPNEGNVVALEVLEKEVAKLKEFFSFQKEAVEKFQSEIVRLTSSKVEFVSKTYFSTFGKFVSILATLDELKNIKASIKNDFAYYKRISGKISKKPELSNEVREMSLFLATHNCILGEVKKLLVAATGFEELFCNVINSCVAKFEQKDYLLPEEKYDLVKVTAFLTYLTDSQSFNINKSKKLNLPKIDSMLKQVEVLPLFGDMMFRAFNYIERTPNFDASHWPKCMSGDASPQSSLVNLMPTYRQQHANVLSEYTLTMQGIQRNKVESQEIKVELAGRAYDLAISVLGTLSTWTTCIVELVSWKLTHPAEVKTERPGSTGCPPEASNYERVTKYNYSNEEKSSLVELIGFIKGLHGLVRRDERIISSLINLHIFVQLQRFVNVGLGEPIRKATKHHKDVLIHMLTALQGISSDPSSVAQKEVEIKKGKKTETIQFIIPKQAPPSQTQMYLVQSMLEFLVDKSNSRSPGKDLESHHLKSMKEFLNSTLRWNHALQFEESLKMSCDLSQLWYREFYLEMTRGEKIQFPIEESLTWILISHVLEKKDPYLIHFVLNLFDLYDDYAQFDLSMFKKQFLFCEIEAEATLCFEQLVFKLSEYIYEQHKVQAASTVLSKQFGVSSMKNHSSTQVNYKPLMSQKNIQLLGRSVNLHQRLSQMMNELLLKSINVSITRFEFSDITGIVELQTLFKINKETHRLLSRILNLDNFEALWHEANHSITAPYGRVSTYTLLELTSDFLPHYCYNSSTGRFVMTVLPFADKCKRDKPPNPAACHLYGTKTLTQCYSAIHSRLTNFVGEPHFTAMVELLGYQDIAMLAKELVANNASLIRNTLLPYLTSLQGAMPKKCTLPRYDYTSSGVLGYYEMQLAAILTYSDLQPKVFQCLREIGNSIVFVNIIEHYQTVRENLELASSAMFLNIFPKPYLPREDGKEPEEVEKELKKLISALESKYRFQNVQLVMSKNASDEQNSACKENILLTRDKLCSGLYIFRTFLIQLRSELLLTDDPLFNPIFTPTSPSPSSFSSSSSLWCVEANTEFHRLWSAMQFVMCRTLGQNEMTVEELFGEGLSWAGCTLVFLLGQQHRYQLMDFCYHLHNVNRVDQIDKICAGVPLRKMVDRIRKFQILNDDIFSSLIRHLSPGDGTAMLDFGTQVEDLEPMNPDFMPKGCEVSLV